MRKFTFGRKYNKGWRTFDLDYEKMYSNVPNPCAEVSLPTRSRFLDRVVEMNEQKRVILTRMDMTRVGLRKSLALIDAHDFTITREKFSRAELVVFVDDDGSTKILKNRY